MKGRLSLSWKRRARRGALLLTPLLGIGCLTIQADPALAYSGPNAAAYANRWATTDNTAQYPVYSSDCTNFVSQAVYAGGYPFRNKNQNQVDAWYGYYQAVGNPNIGAVQWESSVSWINVVAFHNFLLVDYPGGVAEGTAPGSSTNYYTPNSVVTGDVLFFDWGQGEGLSHAVIQVGIGDDPNLEPSQVWYGNYIDEHTSNRYHAFWSLKPYNADWKTTTIYFMHVQASN
jgi:hypothetical protein